MVCKWCNKKIVSKRKIFCNTYCASNYIEMTNIELPQLWVNRISRLDNSEKVKEIVKFSEFHKLNPEFVERKVIYLNELNSNKQKN